MEKKFRLVIFTKNWAQEITDLTFEDAVEMSRGFLALKGILNGFLGFLGADPAERKEWVRQISEKDSDLIEDDER